MLQKVEAFSIPFIDNMDYTAVLDLSKTVLLTFMIVIVIYITYNQLKKKLIDRFNHRIDNSCENQKELTQRTVRFDDRIMIKSESHNRFGNNRNFRDSRTFYPKEVRQKPYNRDYVYNDSRYFNSNYNTSKNANVNEEKRDRKIEERVSNNDARNGSKEKATIRQQRQNQTMLKNTRTPKEALICYFCNEAGHIQYRCPAKKELSTK
jgi:hypothetical protein